MLEQKIYFKSLDALRFFAFLMVFCQHAFRVDIPKEETGTVLYYFLQFFCNGALGVSFFFVLSGFLITYLILQEKEKTGTIHVLFFYMRRTLRIWPLYYAVVVFALLIYPNIRTLFGMDYFAYGYNKIMHFLFLSNFDLIRTLKETHGKNSVLVSITWSVSIEEQFYLIWPLLFRFLSRKLYPLIFPSIILISLAFRLANQDDNLVLYFHTFSVMNDLAMGGWAAYLCIYNPSFRNLVNTLNRFSLKAIYIAGFSLLLYEHIFLQLPFVNAFVRILECLFFVFIIMEQNFSVHSFVKFGNWKLFSLLGTITYGLYLIHPICIHFTEITWKYLNLSNPVLKSHPFQGLIGLAVSIGVCFLSFRFYESYFLRLKNRFSFIKTIPNDRNENPRMKPL